MGNIPLYSAACWYIALAMTPPALLAQEPETQIKQGEYMFNAAGCASCHTADDGAPLAGGLRMETPFGTFITPNITPDKETGIGKWDEDDFITAMTRGISPSGEHYYPSFPYTSYTNMSRSDLTDMKRYLDSVPAIKRPNEDHELGFPFNIRAALGFWKAVNFDEGNPPADPNSLPTLERGKYLVTGPGHCAECHSPRNLLGGLDSDQFLQGNPNGPEGESVPGITMSEDNRVSEWSNDDLVFSLQLGMIPDGDFLGGSMGHVIENSTSKLIEGDLRAISHYLENL